jgi:hypothetical protein
VNQSHKSTANVDVTAVFLAIRQAFRELAMASKLF